MSKKGVPDNFMDDFLKSGGRDPYKEGDPQTPDKNTTEAPQETHKRTTNDPQTTHNMTKYHVRFEPATWERLKAEAAARGLSVSAMLRMIVAAWLKGE